MKTTLKQAARSSMLLALAALMIPALGCGLSRSPRPAVRYYSLDYPAPARQEGPALPVTIRVERFSAAPELNGAYILYSDAPYAMTAYSLYKWRSAPADTAAYFIARDMLASGAFAAALPYDTQVSPTLSLEGRVEKFYEQDGPKDKISAVLSISVTLVRQMEPDVTKRIVFQKTYDETEPARVNNPQAVAEAMSLALSRVSSRLIGDVKTALAADAPKK